MGINRQIARTNWLCRPLSRNLSWRLAEGYENGILWAYEAPGWTSHYFLFCPETTVNLTSEKYITYHLYHHRLNVSFLPVALTGTGNRSEYIYNL